MRFSALLLDVGGVFIIPDRELIVEALSSVGVATENLDTDRAHYLGMAAVDRDEGDGDLYLEGYLAALGATRTIVPVRSPPSWVSPSNRRSCSGSKSSPTR